MADVEKTADTDVVNGNTEGSHGVPEPAEAAADEKKSEENGPTDADDVNVPVHNSSENGVNKSDTKVDAAASETEQPAGSADSKEEDTILLYTPPRKLCRYIIPSPSPPALKLETWLRLKKLDYKAMEVTKGSKSTGLIPYIMYKGEEITDSSIIMRELTKKFELDPTEGLTAQELAISRAFQKMLDENTYWTLIWQRINTPMDTMRKWVDFPGPKFTNGLFFKIMSRKISGRFKAQGMGLLPYEEIREIVRGDVTALSDFLGEKQFMMGDNPTSLDCSVFGIMSQFLYVDIPSTHREIVEQHCPNMMPYMDRVKAAAWPDWDQICTGKVLE